MPDIVESEVILPRIPEDLLLEIFARSDGKTVGRCRILSMAWNGILQCNAFVGMHLIHAKKRSSSAFVHFGMEGPRAIGSWVMRFNVDTGNREALRMPCLRNNHGRIQFVGSENGNVAIRYASDRRGPSLIVWNPTTLKVRRLDDPMMHAGLFGTCAYAFSYIPDTMDYVWIYIYKQSIADQECLITSYSTVRGTWEIAEPAPIYVQVLDPKYVVHKGNVYWISWNNRGVTRPQCIVHYSIITKEFGYILIPANARSLRTRLLVHNDCLAFATVHRAAGVYRWLLWKIREGDGNPSWSLWSEYNGIGLPAYPECFEGDEIVTIQDTSQFSFHGRNSGGTRISICKVNPDTNNRRELQLEVAPFPFYVKSLTMNVESVASVDGSQG